MGKTEAFEQTRFAAFLSRVEARLGSPASGGERGEAQGWFRLGVPAELAASSIAASRRIGSTAGVAYAP